MSSDASMISDSRLRPQLGQSIVCELFCISLDAASLSDSKKLNLVPFRGILSACDEFQGYLTNAHRKDTAGKTEVAKVGISGQPLNQNGTSPRANRQVNSFNRDDDGYEYFASIEESGIPGRKAALEWERDMAATLRSAGAVMEKHVRP